MLFPNRNQRTNLPTVVVPTTFMSGTNIGGLTQADFQVPLVNGTNGKALVSSDYSYLTSVGNQCCRYLLSQEILQSNQSSGNNVPYGEFANSANWALVRDNINALTAAGQYVLIGRHEGQDAQFGTYNWTGSNQSVSSFKGTGNQSPASILADFWCKIIYALGVNRTDFGISLDNEWLLSSDPSIGWPAVAKHCFKAIRATGFRGLITVPGASYSGAATYTSVPYTEPSPVAGIPNSTNMINLFNDLQAYYGCTYNQLGIAVEIHSYMSSSGSGANTDVVSGTIGRTRLAAAIAHATANKYKIVIAEWGNQFSVTNGTANATDYNSYLKENSIDNGGVIMAQYWWVYASYPFFNGDNFTLTRQGAAYPGGTHSACMSGLLSIGYFNPVVPYDPLTAPNIYARHRASDYSSGTITNSAGVGDSTRNMVICTGGTFVSPDISSSDTDFYGQPSVGCTSVSGGRTTGFVNAGGGMLTTSITGACTVYGVYYINAPPSPSTCFLRSSRSNQAGGTATTIVAGGPSLYHFSNYQATRDNVTAVGGGATTGLRIICNVYNGTSSATYVNSTTALATGNAGSMSIVSLGYGNANGQAALWRMGEVLMYSSAHGATDIGNIMRYLGRKYGIIIS